MSYDSVFFYDILKVISLLENIQDNLFELKRLQTFYIIAKSIKKA